MHWRGLWGRLRAEQGLPSSGSGCCSVTSGTPMRTCCVRLLRASSDIVTQEFAEVRTGKAHGGSARQLQLWEATANHPAENIKRVADQAGISVEREIVAVVKRVAAALVDRYGRRGHKTSRMTLSIPLQDM